MAYKYAGRIIRAGKAWTDNNGMQHPSNWMAWSNETKLAKGLVWDNDPAKVDGRFYWSAELPKAIKQTMKFSSKLMTGSVYYI